MSGPPSSALVVGAHPDDCELGCGGTVAKWAAAGARVALLVLTDGTKGSHDADVPDAELRDRREAEQRAGAAELGLAEVRFLRRVDGELEADPELVLTVAAAIRELRPEVVLTHDPWLAHELHADHVATGRVVLAALYAARAPRAARELAARGLAPWRPRELLLFRPQDPDRYEDVGMVFDRKVRALLCHESQYATSFGLHGDEDDAEAFAAELRERALAPSPGDDRLVEAFKCLALPG